MWVCLFFLELYFLTPPVYQPSSQSSLTSQLLNYLICFSLILWYSIQLGHYSFHYPTAPVAISATLISLLACGAQTYHNLYHPACQAVVSCILRLRPASFRAYLISRLVFAFLCLVDTRMQARDSTLLCILYEVICMSVMSVSCHVLHYASCTWSVICNCSSPAFFRSTENQPACLHIVPLSSLDACLAPGCIKYFTP